MSSTIPTNNDKGQFITWKQKCTNNLGIIEGPRQGLCHVFLGVPKLERHDLKTWFFFHKVSKTMYLTCRLKVHYVHLKIVEKKLFQNLANSFWDTLDLQITSSSHSSCIYLQNQNNILIKLSFIFDCRAWNKL